MHKLTAIHKFVKGRPVWEVNVPLSVCGKRVRLSRLTEREALAAANQWVVENQRFGTEHSDLTTAERAFVMHLREKKIPLRDAAKAAEKTARKSVPLLRALNEYMRTQVGNSKSHLQSLKNYYTRFAREFPHRDIAEITSADIAGYLFAHKSNERQIYGRLRQFFRWCVMMDYVERNPVERVPKPDPDNKERQVFTPDQMRALLKAAAGTPVVLRYLVLGGFFGLRPSEVEKLRCEDIDLEHAEIHVRNMKTSKRGLRERYVSASPEAIPNGRAWLESLKLPAKGRVIDMNSKNLRLNKDAVIARANGDDPKAAMKPVAKAAGRKGKLIEWHYNVLRRSFASYHLAAFENQNLTAALMGHTTSDTTFAKYRAARRKADGVAWFGIAP